MSPKAATYGFPFIMIHWLMALLIVLLLGLGWYAQTLATESTVRAFFMEVHISLVLMAYFIRYKYSVWLGIKASESRFEYHKISTNVSNSEVLNVKPG